MKSMHISLEVVIVEVVPQWRSLALSVAPPPPPSSKSALVSTMTSLLPLFDGVITLEGDTFIHMVATK
jgi:hypothetical protein